LRLGKVLLCQVHVSCRDLPTDRERERESERESGESDREGGREGETERESFVGTNSATIICHTRERSAEVRRRLREEFDAGLFGTWTDPTAHMSSRYAPGNVMPQRALPHAGCLTIPKLTCWVCGTHSSTLQQERDRAHEFGEPELSETPLGKGMGPFHAGRAGPKRRDDVRTLCMSLATYAT
jgi:hypothetical protein